MKNKKKKSAWMKNKKKKSVKISVIRGSHLVPARPG